MYCPVIVQFQPVHSASTCWCCMRWPGSRRSLSPISFVSVVFTQTFSPSNTIIVERMAVVRMGSLSVRCCFRRFNDFSLSSLFVALSCCAACESAGKGRRPIIFQLNRRWAVLVGTDVFRRSAASLAADLFARASAYAGFVTFGYS